MTRFQRILFRKPKNHFERLMIQQLQSGGDAEIKEVSGIPPLALPDSVGQPLTAYSITGATEQDGEPSPENPVEVCGVGDKTGNLLPLTDGSNTFGGITIERKNGSADIYGTAINSGGRLNLITGKSIVLEAGTYTLDTTFTTDDLYVDGWCVSNAVTKGAIKSAVSANSIAKSFTLSETTEVIVGFNMISEKTYNLKGIKVWINSGSTALPYEPYGYKIPILTSGKNLYNKDSKDISKGYETSKYITIQGNTGFSSNHDISEYIYVKGFSYFTYSNQQPQSIIACAFYDINKQYISVSPLAVNTIAVPTNAYYMRFTIRKTNVDDLQIEFGEIATPYEPYTETTTTIYTDKPLYSGEVLRSTGERDVKWGVVDLGSLKWNLDGDTFIYSQDFKFGREAKLNSENQCISEQGQTFVIKSQCKDNTYFTISGGLFLEFKRMNNMSASQFKESMSGVKFYYILAEPTTEPIGLPEIPTLSGTNVLSVQTEVQPENVMIRYKTDKAIKN